MFCPQCGVESPPRLPYCRSCGANLKVIGKALTLSEAIARSDRGPLPKLKEMVKNFNVDAVTEEVSRAMDRMNKELMSHPQQLPGKAWWQKQKKTPRERREEQITKGTISFFSGIGLMIFLFYFSAALVLKLPPDVLTSIPVELEPLLRVVWLVGLIPTLSGVGHIIAGLLIRPRAYENFQLGNEADQTSQISDSRGASAAWSDPAKERASVTERTTNLLER